MSDRPDYQAFTPASLRKAFDTQELLSAAIAADLAQRELAKLESKDPHSAPSALLAKLGYDLQQVLDTLRRALDYEIQAQLDAGLITYSEYCRAIGTGAVLFEVKSTEMADKLEELTE